jgi:hypothetical protein
VTRTGFIKYSVAFLASCHFESDSVWSPDK